MKEGLEAGLQEGLVAEARNFVLLIGRKRLGEPDGRTLEILQGLNGREPLEEIGQRILDARDWAEAPGRSGPRPGGSVAPGVLAVWGRSGMMGGRSGG